MYYIKAKYLAKLTSLIIMLLMYIYTSEYENH